FNLVFFFSSRRRHTRFSRDWSSDVCSSDLSYGGESVNNSIFGVNANYATEIPFLTRWVNKLPNIDTDVESNLSVRGEFAYLLPRSEERRVGKECRSGGSPDD